MLFDEHYLTFLAHYVSKKGIRDNLMCDMKLLEMIKYEIFTCLSKKNPPAFSNNYYKILRVCVCISYCTSYEELQKKILSFNKNAFLNSQNT